MRGKGVMREGFLVSGIASSSNINEKGGEGAVGIGKVRSGCFPDRAKEKQEMAESVDDYTHCAEEKEGGAATAR